MKSFWRFVILSGGGWLLDCSILLLLTQAGAPLSIANFISSATAALTVFLASRFLVFVPGSDAIVGRAAVYLIYQTASILAASLLIGPAAQLASMVCALGGLHFSNQVISFLGKIVITPPQLAANFMVSRYLIQYSGRSISHA